MLPLALLHAAQNKPMMVELKTGETFNGHLVRCDNFMNLTLKEVYQTSATGENFWKMEECYVRGNTIKYIQVAENVIEAVKEQEAEYRKGPSASTISSGRGGGPGGDRGRGGRGGGGGRGGRGGPDRGRGGRGGGRGGDRGRGR